MIDIQETTNMIHEKIGEGIKTITQTFSQEEIPILEDATLKKDPEAAPSLLD